MLYCNVLYCTVVYSVVLWYVALYCNLLYFNILSCTLWYSTVLYCIVLHSTVLYCTVLYCTVILPLVSVKLHLKIFIIMSNSFRCFLLTTLSTTKLLKSLIFCTQYTPKINHFVKSPGNSPPLLQLFVHYLISLCRSSNLPLNPNS
jgi:hypothetical protein